MLPEQTARPQLRGAARGHLALSWTGLPSLHQETLGEMGGPALRRGGYNRKTFGVRGGGNAHGDLDASPASQPLLSAVHSVRPILITERRQVRASPHRRLRAIAPLTPFDRDRLRRGVT